MANKHNVACCIYGGALKAGYTCVIVTNEFAEAVFDKYTEHYGDVKLRYVKFKDSLEETSTKINESLNEHKLSENSTCLYKLNMEEVIKIFKSITGAKKASILGQSDKETKQNDADDTTVAKDKVKKTKAKTKKDDDDDEKVEETTPKKTKPKTKQTGKGDEETIEATGPTKKTKSKPKQTQKDDDVEENEDDPEPIIPLKKNVQVKKNVSDKQKQIVISDDEDEEEQDA